MATAKKPPALLSPRTDAARGLILLVVVVLGLSFLMRGCSFGDDASTTDAAAPAVTVLALTPISAGPSSAVPIATSSAPSPPVATVLNVTGLTLDVVQKELSGADTRAHDQELDRDAGCRRGRG